MLFSDALNTNRCKIHLDTIKSTKKGGLKMKASDPMYPGEEPGYITFNSKEVEQFKKAIKAHEQKSR